ncbi:Rhodanese-related sulfurtransferase [Cognatiyoonia koreensis]|uniref:Rhodanese-related sulfurtransferase n=1 Tax=Cognatiyoonia koreensis TaxID=364200 RepID=A0A1I0RM95_9RHOB|nr:rhodanese-like domain-containing protein [Cognatiyoonia koreensis]SEW42304.1 Rhodanese-related sulfurtransferase [Cognatiyoonia koreensis]
MISRRRALQGLVGLGAIGVAAFVGPDLFYAAITPTSEARTLTPPEAYDAAKAGQIILVDIRRPDEWASTGSPEGGHRVDLRTADFAQTLAMLVDGNKDAPIALICARGVRSARTSNMLLEAGFTNIIDVPEGMLGSPAGPGWIRRELPLDHS